MRFHPTALRNQRSVWSVHEIQAEEVLDNFHQVAELLSEALKPDLHSQYGWCLYSVIS